MQDKINLDITQAMKSGDKQLVDTLRLFKSALLNTRIALGHDLNDDEVIKVIRKEMKSRAEARDMYRNNDRPELADKEDYELKVYEAYVPSQLSAEAIDQLIKEQAAILGDSINFAALMPKVIQASKGQADGKLVSERVKLYLNGAN